MQVLHRGLIGSHGCGHGTRSNPELKPPNLNLEAETSAGLTSEVSNSHNNVSHMTNSSSNDLEWPWCSNDLEWPWRTQTTLQRLHDYMRKTIPFFNLIHYFIRLRFTFLGQHHFNFTITGPFQRTT